MNAPTPLYCSAPGCAENATVTREGNTYCKHHDLIFLETQADIRRRLAALQVEIEELAKHGIRLKVVQE